MTKTCAATSCAGSTRAGAIDGSPVKGYREEPGVKPDSMTETYVALRLGIENWRWAGVPFYLRTGKRLARRTTEIAIQFKQAPFALFRDTPVDILTPNVLILQIQPDEGISLQFGAKMPGPRIELGKVRMDFRYKDYFHTEPSTGYETLVYDCMIGDAMLFNRADGVEAGWAVVQPILDLWAEDKTVPLELYPAGGAGPDGGRQSAVAQRPAMAAADPIAMASSVRMARPVIVAPSILSADFGRLADGGAGGRPRPAATGSMSM